MIKCAQTLLKLWACVLARLQTRGTFNRFDFTINDCIAHNIIQLVLIELKWIELFLYYMDELIPVIAIGINQLPNNMRKFYSNPSA